MVINMNNFFKGWSVFVFVATHKSPNDNYLGYHVIAENLLVAKNLLGAYFQRECKVCRITLCAHHKDLTLQKEVPLGRMVVAWKFEKSSSQGQVIKYGDS